MSKTRHQVQPREEAKAPGNQRLIQIVIIAGVVLVAAGLLLLKNRTAEPAAVAPPQHRLGAGVATLQVPAGDEIQDTLAALPGELPQAHLERLLAAGQPTLAFFHSNNCAQCTKMMKIVADVYPEFEGSVALVDVDVYDPQNRELLVQAQIHSIPTQIFYNAAGEGKLTVGALPTQVFRTYMRAATGEE